MTKLHSHPLDKLPEDAPIETFCQLCKELSITLNYLTIIRAYRCYQKSD